METSTIRTVKGIVALVTGGASGLGRATVERLSHEGAKGIMAFDRNFSEKITINNVLSFTGDVTSEDDVKKALDQLEKTYGRLDVVVNCAGILLMKPVYDFIKKMPHPLDEFKMVLEVNTVGTFNVNRLSVELIAKNDPQQSLRGVLINTASISAFEGTVGQCAYSASKGAVVGMTLPIARDLAFQGIRCVTIAPGPFETPFLASVPETIRKSLGDTVPCPSRLGIADEFAHLVQSIIENPMINGEVIRLDGALRMQP